MAGVPAGALVAVFYGLTSLAASVHALLTTADPRSAVAWIGMCWLFPFGGPLLYWLFGINRVRRNHPFRGAPHPGGALPPALRTPSLQAQTRIGDALTRRPLEADNRIEALFDGERAFPTMLDAIARAERRVWLATYIFQTDAVGRQFVDALASAVRRGVEVRVLVDGIGEWYDWPHVVPMLRRAGVPAARFLPPRMLPPNLSLNCRNHRKILVVDGRDAFMGGMNLGGREVGGSTGLRMRDIHFRITGPIVHQLSEVFAEDWEFATTERLVLDPGPGRAGRSTCRVITGGPDRDLDTLLLVIVGAVAGAQRRVQIMTPYFIPPPELIAALETAALRGVEVSVVLPRRSNLHYIDWATLHWIPALVRRGVRVHFQAPPFSHAKLFVVDGLYAHIGSVNVDTRSLRLNFEIAIEVYDDEFCQGVSDYIERVRASAPVLSVRDTEPQSFLLRMRNALCWLVSPYL